MKNFTISNGGLFYLLRINKGFFQHRIFFNFFLKIVCFSFLSLIIFQINLTSVVAGTDYCVQDNLSTESAYSVATADINGDESLDVVAALYDKGEIVWHANDGEGNFGTAQEVTGDAANIQFIYVVDINGDNDSDILAAMFSGEIMLYTNDGSGNFTSTIIDDDCIGATGVYAADLVGDGDGKLDIISASSNSDKVTWYKYSGPLETDFTEMANLDFDGATCVIAADINNDSRVDIVASSKSGDKIVWFEKEEGESYANTQNIISNVAYGSTSIIAMDIGGDERVDIISASGGSGTGNVVTYTDKYGDEISLDGAGAGQNVEWYENIAGEFTLKRIIIPDAEGSNNIITTANVDNDIIDDLIITSQRDGDVFFCIGKRKGTDVAYMPPYNPFEPAKPVSLNVDRVRGVATGDIDGDGDDDIVSASYAAHSSATQQGKVGWYKNVNSYIISPISGNTTEENEGTATFTIRLDTRPEDDTTVKIDVSSSNTAEGTVSPSSLEFTTSNWDEDQTVTARGVDDIANVDDDTFNPNDNDQLYSIILDNVVSEDPDYKGTDPDDVELLNIDNDDDNYLDGTRPATSGGGESACFIESCLF